MKNPTLEILVDRLLWPPPRVRWEVARNLANLIRNGDALAADALLSWISNRRLESEVVIGLSVVDAYQLGAHFEFSALSGAVKAPSLLSDWMLKRNFETAEGLWAFRYAFAPQAEAPLPDYQKKWFNQYRLEAIPRIFSTTMSKLERSSGLPFMARWEHEWQWVQAIEPRPCTTVPRYFFGTSMNQSGQLDIGQREVYVSAFLRTLAFAVSEWGMPQRLATQDARTALLLNRGLAEVEPIERPSWTLELLNILGEPGVIGEYAWKQVRSMTAGDETPIAAQLIAVSEDRCLDIELGVAIARSSAAWDSIVPAKLQNIRFLDSPDFWGTIAKPPAGKDSIDVLEPMVLTQIVLPEELGRFHSSIGTSVKLLAPDFIGKPATLKSSNSVVYLEVDQEVISKWTYWYVDWAPTTPRELGTQTSWLTTIRNSELAKLQAHPDLELRSFAQVRRIEREASYSEYKVIENLVWSKL